MGIFGFLHKAASNARDSTQLWQLFQDDEKFARLARLNLQRACDERGRRYDVVLSFAKVMARNFPNATIGMLLDRHDKDK